MRAFLLICCGRVKIHVATDAVRVMILLMNTSVCLQLELKFLGVSIFIFLSARILTKTCSVLAITDSDSVFCSHAARSHIKKNEEIKLVLCCLCRRLL